MRVCRKFSQDGHMESIPVTLTSKESLLSTYFYLVCVDFDFLKTGQNCQKEGNLIFHAGDDLGTSSTYWVQACVSQKTRKLLGPGNRKAPETTFGCFSKHPKTFDPEKYVFFPRKLHGSSLPPEKRFRVCFSCTCLIKWPPPTYFLGQNKWPRSCIKRERVEEGRENNVVRKYGFYQNEFQWLTAVNRQISKHYRVRLESQRNFHTCQAV